MPVTALAGDSTAKKKTGPGEGIFKRIDTALREMTKPSPKDKATFFRLLAIMLNAGIPLIKSLDTIAEQTANPRLKKAILDVARTIELGGTLSDSMGQYSDIFSESQLGMIRSGEASGQLNQVLKELALQVEKSAAIVRKVRGAMIYPAFIIAVMILVVVVMMVFVIPKISQFFTQSGNELPALTRAVIGISHFMTDRWYVMVGAVAVLVFGIGSARRTAKGRMAIDWFLLKMPLFGGLFQKSILARFSRSLGSLLSSGIPIIHGLHINANGLGNEIYRKRIMLAAEDISRGIQLGESLRDSPEFPSMLVQMISVGEQTAQLDSIAVKIAEYYEDEVDTAVASLSKIMEPALLVIMGGVAGIIVAAIMLPIFQLTQIAGVA